MTATTAWRTRTVLVLGMIGTVTVLGSSTGSNGPSDGTQVGGPRLISVEALPDPDEGLMCAWPGGSAIPTAAARQQGAGSAGTGPQKQPVRVIKNPYAAFSAVAVDPLRNEVVFTDESTFGINVYDRLANTPPTAAFTEPKRRISGPNAHIEYMCSIYIDPASGDIYAVNNDTHDNVAIYTRQAAGNVPPVRELTIPHSGFGIAVDEVAQEMFVTNQHDNAITVFRKSAQNEESPIRLLQGDKTLLADPRNLAIDPKNRLLFVINHGNFHSNVPGGIPSRILGGSGMGGRVNARVGTGKQNWPVGDPVPGSGKYLPPSINVYALNAKGDTAPLRIISGDKTQMNWPMGIAFDPKRNELVVANDTGQSVLVFSAAANGNVAPVRVVKGPKTLMKNPTGVTVDLQNDELWVANFGNHTATVFSPTASGDVAPLRVIRSAPTGTPAPIIGNPGFVAYDSKRDELLVPN